MTEEERFRRGGLIPALQAAATPELRRRSARALADAQRDAPEPLAHRVPHLPSDLETITPEETMTTPDAMTSGPAGPERVPVRVLLLFGDQAELTTPARGPENPERVPVARLVAETGLAREELPGARLVAVLGADGAPERFERATD